MESLEFDIHHFLPFLLCLIRLKDQKENDRLRNLLHLHSEATMLLQVLACCVEIVHLKELDTLDQTSISGKILSTI